MPFVSASAISPYNDIRGGAEGGVTETLLLDLYPGAAAAYSLRHLRTAYTGSAIQVRRSSDDTLQDIGFLEGALDTASLLSFVGSGDGFVRTWYDQSGNGNDAVQASTLTKQPKIVSSGVLNETDTKPSIAFNLDALVAGQDAIIDGGLAAFAVATTDAFGKYVPYAKAKAGAAPNRWGKYSQAFICIDSVGASRPINYNPSSDFGVNRITTQEIKNDPNALHEVFENGALVAAASTTSNPIVSNSFNLVIGVYNDSSGGGSATTYSHLGNISELVFYGTDQSANRRAIETNANNYYSIYPTVLDFNPYNVWDSEHISINNTTTTFTDFNTVGTTYDLVNPAASNQPAYTSSDSDFRGLPSITFDGAGEYVSNAVSSYRVGDSSGMYIGVFKYNSGGNFNFFTSCSSSSNTTFIRQARFPGVTQYIHRQGGGTTTVDTTQSAIDVGDVTIQALAGDASNFIAYNETGVIPDSVTGSYKWFDSVAGRTNIGIGASLNPAIRYADITWCMSGYFPYVDDATTESLITALKNKYIDAPIPVDPILAFNPTNVWDSEHVIVNGTETTFVDFSDSEGGNYDLTNPAATNQPAYIFSDADFNNLPSFDFGVENIDNYLVADIGGNFRGSDTSGAFISVYRLGSLSALTNLAATSTANNEYVGFSATNTNTYRFVTFTGAGEIRSWRGNTNINNTTTSYAVANINTGSSYKQWINETPQTITMTSAGTGNDGAVWTGTGEFDTLSMGCLVRSNGASNFSDIKWCFSGYFPYESDSQIEEIMTYLVTKYGL